MTDAWVYFICGMLTMTCPAVWFGIQVGQERGRREAITEVAEG